MDRKEVDIEIDPSMEPGRIELRKEGVVVSVAQVEHEHDDYSDVAERVRMGLV